MSELSSNVGTALRATDKRREGDVIEDQTSSIDACEDDGGDGARGRGGGGRGGVAIITLGIERLDEREDWRYAGGGEVVDDVRFILVPNLPPLYPFSVPCTPCIPFKFSLDPPSVKREIMRWKRPDLVFPDSNEIILGVVGGSCVSSGGPSSRKSMSSLAALEMYGFPLGGAVGVLGLLDAFTDDLMDDLAGVGKESSSSSDPPITSSRSMDSRL